MISWPEAVVICVVLLVGYGTIDTLLKRPYFEKRVGNMSIKMRGKEASVAMAHYNSMAVMGFVAALDEASGERDNLDARTYPELDDEEIGRAANVTTSRRQ